MRGDGRIYKRGGVYWVCYYLRGEQFREAAKDKNGENVRDPEEARKFLRARLKEIHADEIGARKFTTPQAHRLIVAQLCQSLKQRYELLGKASNQNLCHLARAEKDFGRYLATALSSATVDRYIQNRLADGDRPATINRTTGMLLQAFKHAVRSELLTHVPHITHLSEKGNERKGFLAPAQFETLLAHIPSDLKDFVEWGYKTGQRKGEASLMTWSMLDGDVLRLPGDIAKNREARTLPLSTELAAIIERRKLCRRVDVNGTAQLCEFIFHRNGEPIGEFKKSWATASVAAGLGTMVCPKCRGEGTARTCERCNSATHYRGRIYHDLRRSCVKNLTDAGVRSALAMRVGGWQTESMLKRYQISVDEEVRAAMEQTDRYVTAAKAKAQAATNVVAMSK